MSGHAHSNSGVDKQDAADLKKAIATGQAKESASNPVYPIVCYCMASILMTVVNKFVVSGANFSMNFLLLCIQSTVCVSCVAAVKKMGIISFRAFDMQDAKAWFPISFLLVSVIYTGSKSLQFLSIPVYTIFKNLTIILIAYGEVIWFGGKVTGLTFVSFVFMVFSSIIAAWSDVNATLNEALPVTNTAMNFSSLQDVRGMVARLNVGYMWMLINCVTSAAYVSSWLPVNHPVRDEYRQRKTYRVFILVVVATLQPGVMELRWPSEP
ncbi:hypothetical protein HGRIS_004645 [Hohenbuehelia grisea]|uniref:GDP-mannose transporter n=1 Tax=Hohenbuehelia grisea TaxID=104357 RepID=A0ABR3JCW8_9AGAR